MKDIEIIELICNYFHVKYEDLIEIKSYEHKFIRRFCIYFLKLNEAKVSNINNLLGIDNYTWTKTMYNRIEQFFRNSGNIFSNHLLTISSLITYESELRSERNN